MKTKTKIITAVVAGVVILGAVGIVKECQPKDVDLRDYIVANVEGYSGKGYISDFYIDDKYFMDDMDLKATISKTENISNGDEIEIDVSYNKEIAEKYGVNFTHSHAKWSVHGLIDTETDEHYFTAQFDMNDEFAKIMLNTVLDELYRDLGILDTKIESASLLGVYVDKETGRGSCADVLVKVINRHDVEGSIYFCFDVSSLENYSSKTKFSDLKAVDTRDVILYKTDHCTTLNSYCISQEELDSTMKKVCDTEQEFIEYKWDWDSELQNEYSN